VHDRTGTRGGTVGSLPEAQELFTRWRAEEWGWLKETIVRLADQYGEYHADHLSTVAFDQPNIIGAVVNSLARSGVIEKLNADGVPEHRRSISSAAHRRHSWVWRLTFYGQRIAQQLEGEAVLVPATEDAA